MIDVLKVNKVGNRISSYSCSEDGKVFNLTKQQLSDYIDSKRVSNATKQVYKGTLIIRINDKKGKVDQSVINKSTSDKTLSKSVQEKHEAMVAVVNHKIIQQVNCEKHLRFKQLNKEKFNEFLGRASVMGLEVKNLSSDLVSVTNLTGVPL